MGPANELANASSELVTGLGRIWANHGISLIGLFMFVVLIQVINAIKYLKIIFTDMMLQEKSSTSSSIANLYIRNQYFLSLTMILVYKTKVMALLWALCVKISIMMYMNK